MRQTRCLITGRMIEVSDCKLEFNKIELAWAAGFFDGEGCITATAKGNNGCWTFRVNVTQVDQRPLNRFLKAVGLGKIYTSNKGFVIQKNTLEFANFEKGQAVIAMLWSYMSEPKKEQYKRCVKDYLAAMKTNRRSIAASKMWEARHNERSLNN